APSSRRSLFRASRLSAPFAARPSSSSSAARRPRPPAPRRPPPPPPPPPAPPPPRPPPRPPPAAPRPPRGSPAARPAAPAPRDAPGLRLVHDGRGAERAPRDGTHPLVGAAQVGVGGCAGRAQRLRGLDVPGPARPRVLTPGGVARYCGAGRRRLSARKPGGSG